jgi:excisionase family DNA binding protein
MIKSAFSIREFARVVGICRTKIYQEMRTGRIHARRSGRRILIPATEVGRYLRLLPLVRPTQPRLSKPEEQPE